MRTSDSNLLVTGFGPFLSNKRNPSQYLAETCGQPFRILEVSYRLVDEWIESLQPGPPQSLLLIGLHGRANKFHIEMVAHNYVGKTPDNEGIAYGPGPIEPRMPSQLASTLWQHPSLLQETDEWIPSASAGDYLCNYVLFRALEKLPGSKIGFLHVPKEAEMAIEAQQAVVGKMLSQLIQA